MLVLDEPEDQFTAAVHAALSIYRHLMDDKPLSGDPESGEKPQHDQPQAVPKRHAGRARKRGR